MRDLNEFLTKNFNPPLMLLTFFTSIPFFKFNHFLKKMQLSSNFILKWLNYIKK